LEKGCFWVIIKRKENFLRVIRNYLDPVINIFSEDKNKTTVFKEEIRGFKMFLKCM
jgi:hypothetical protein